MTTTRIGIYPGTFDPITLGHIDILGRAAKIVDRLIVAVAVNPAKTPFFPLEERLALIEGDIAQLTEAGHKIEVTPFDNLLTEFASQAGASIILRGLRAVSDFEYEFQMAGMNFRLAPDIETVFLMASDRHHFIASRFVKEIAELGGDVTPFVSKAVAQRICARLEETRGHKPPRQFASYQG
ncbi:MAG: pantetheine-phosphate adenylyltransferase [Pseudomonadota bacterium]|nr:pantetheine-phosphate adenylyltransferase [Pseudomonadota bacterium]